MARRVALVTGGNRGIGLEVARLLMRQNIHVIVGARDADKGRKAAASLTENGVTADGIAIDVTDAASREHALAEIAQRFGAIDILVNNAAVLLEPGGFRSSFFDLSADIMRDTFETNVIAPAQLMRAVIPGMRTRGYGRVVNVSSIAGQLANMRSGYPAYRMSKSAMNALTRSVAAEVGVGNVKINSACPGWCRTGMGGTEADRSAEEGADTIAWLATLPVDGPTGQFFQDRKQMAW